MPKQSKTDRQSSICTFVTTMVDSSSKQTAEDRARWQIALNLFKGIQDFGAERAENPTMSRVFIHEFSKIVRRAAQAAQDIIFERPDFFDILPPDGEEEDIFGKIIEKIVRYRVKGLDLETAMYDFCLMGGIYGVGIMKMFADTFLELKPQFVIQEISKQERARLDKIGKKIDREEVILPEEVPEEQAQAEMQETLAKVFTQDTVFSRGIIPKQISKRKLCIEVINPTNYYFEPDCKDINKTPWEAARDYVKLYELQDLFDAGVLDIKQKDKLKSSTSGTSRTTRTSTSGESYEGQKLLERDQTADNNPYTPTVEIIEYFGDLLSKEGEILERGCWFVVANGTVLLKDAKNPNWNRKTPYYKTIFSKIPNKAIGAGIADNAMNQQMLINNLMSLLVDLMTNAALGAKVASLDQLDDPSEIANGIRPGQVVLARTSDATKVFGDIKFNEFAANPILSTIEKLSYSGEVGSGVDTSNSNPSSRARISASEVQSNIDRSITSLMSLARELDRNLIQETVQRTLDYVLQYDLERPSLEELLDSGVINQTEFSLISNIPPRERFKEISRHYQIQVRGFREKLERNDFLSRIVEFMNQLIQMPAAQEKINWTELLKLLIETYFKDKINIDTLLYQNTPLDQAREENMIMETGHFIQIGEQDQDDQHLLGHYEGIQRNPGQEIVAHTTAHLQRFISMGGTPPEPSPEVAQALGLNQQSQQNAPKEKVLPQ